MTGLTAGKAKSNVTFGFPDAAIEPLNAKLAAPLRLFKDNAPGGELICPCPLTAGWLMSKTARRIVWPAVLRVSALQLADESQICTVAAYNPGRIDAAAVSKWCAASLTVLSFETTEAGVLLA